MNFLIEPYRIRERKTVFLPASKSALNRALLLAALADGTVKLLFGALCEDTEVFLGCLKRLGIKFEFIDGGLIVHGCNGKFPNRTAELDVKNAGTAARFLPAAIAFCGGDCRFTSLEQMSRRPMGLLNILEELGAKIEYFQEEMPFPFRIASNGIRPDSITIDTDESTQYASALLLSGSMRAPLNVQLTGKRTNGAYLKLTLAMMKEFGIPVTVSENTLTILPRTMIPEVYSVEPDLSSASYLCALALLCRTTFLLHGVSLRSGQPDLRFLRLLEKRGCKFTETPEGLIVEGTGEPFEGFDEDFGEFSDQALTAAALAPFATSPSRLKNIAHIRHQESERIQAISENLTLLGVPFHTTANEITIEPAAVRSLFEPVSLKTFHDHRVAMAFSLIGCKTGNLFLDDLDCCKKTFPEFFKLIQTK